MSTVIFLLAFIFTPFLLLVFIVVMEEIVMIKLKGNIVGTLNKALDKTEIICYIMYITFEIGD